MRPKAIRTFELLYFGAIVLVLANAVRDYAAMRESAAGDLVRRGLDPDTLLVASIAFVVGIMVVLWFMAARLRVGFVRYVMVGLLAWQAWPVVTALSEDRGGGIIVAAASVVLQLLAIVFSFLPEARAWFAGDDASLRSDP
ncbi:hypothetical protein [Erythrobacter sp. SD-21]|uniref:hypothetical protein n=1 Tax=Erythrobacter sp. SD-21 TaxID=161528 RepID=UPI000153FD0C|nr:hypothetical protein [Erythrobacter sp. SD-21]EDL49739.1 hypothetical protein ED21_19112 [Erythrobacter sp. SD-21]